MDEKAVNRILYFSEYSQQKKKDHSYKIKVALGENPERFWSYVKSTTNQTSAIIFLRNGQSFITNSYTKANLLNKFFHSVFAAENELNPLHVSRSYVPPNYFNNIQLSTCEVASVLKRLDPNKASGPNGIPNRLLKNVADEIAPSLCSVFNWVVFPLAGNFQTLHLFLRLTIHPFLPVIDQPPCYFLFLKFWRVV